MYIELLYIDVGDKYIFSIYRHFCFDFALLSMYIKNYYNYVMIFLEYHAQLYYIKINIPTPFR